MEESSFVKSGDVNIQIKGFMKTSTQTRFCVLHRKTVDAHPFLEIYESKEAFTNLKTKQKKCDIKKIELNHVKSIRGSSNVTGKGKEYVIDIRCKHAKQILLFDNDRDFNDWTSKLNSVVDITGHDESSSTSILSMDNDDDDGDEISTINQMYDSSEEGKRFDVDVEPSALAKLCDCVGKRTLMVTNTQITFEDPATKRINYSFQVAWLRRFGKKEKIFTFEVGRKCSNGPGEIKCTSVHAKEIHDLITLNSASKGSTVIPAARPPVSSIKAASNHGEAGNIRDASSTSNHQAINNDQSAISSPSLTMAKRHPGHVKLPTLIPITPPIDHNQTTEARDKKDGSHLRHSSKETDSEKETVDCARSTSLKQGPADENFTKQLKLQMQVKKDSSKSKDKKKDDAKEKKENDKKEQEKEKKKDKEKKSWWKKDKDDKDKGKDKSKEKESKDKVTRLPSSSLYEEPDINFTTPPKTPDVIPENLYDEATTTPSNNSSTPSEPVEYAQPFSRKGGVPINVPETLVYADATDIRQNAWKSHGRTENEEHHEENYLSIKDARKENASNGGPPPIPKKQFEPDDDDDTYNTLETNKPFKTAQTASQNIYGTASAKEVGQLPEKLLIPEADYDRSDSEGELVPETQGDGLYDDPMDDGYQAPADLKPSRVSGQGDGYLSKPAPLPVSNKKPDPPQESLYEDIS